MISRHIPSCYSSGILEPFVPEVTKLLEVSNSKNMWNTYQNDIFSFVPFRLNQGLRDTWPSSISDLVNFVAYLSSFGYAPSTVKVYLSGLSHWLRLNQMSDFTQSFIIQTMLKVRCRR
jgi:site-specific recombinase XerD